MTSTGSRAEPARRRVSRRDHRRRETVAEITEVARRLLVADGAEAVTLRGIAAEMGLSAPALYRYYDSRDDLVLALVAELYDELTGVLERARDAETVAETGAKAGAETGRRLVAVCRAFRAWSTAHPAEFGLVFANPLAAVAPGHRSADSAVHRAGERFGAVFVALFVELWATRGFPAPDESRLDPRFVTRPGPVADVLPPGPRWVFLRCWTRLYGAVTLEVFGQLAWAVDDLDPLFDELIHDLGELLDLELDLDLDRGL